MYTEGAAGTIAKIYPSKYFASHQLQLQQYIYSEYEQSKIHGRKCFGHITKKAVSHDRPHLPVGSDVAAPHVVLGLDHVVLHTQEDALLLLRRAGRELDVRVCHERVHVDFRNPRIRGYLIAKRNARPQTNKHPAVHF